MTPLRAIKKMLANKVRQLARAEIEKSIPLMQRIADFAASSPDQRQSAHDLTKDPVGNAPRYLKLVERLKQAGVPVSSFSIDTDAFTRWGKDFSLLDEHCRPFGDVAVEKKLEHFLSHARLDPQPGQVYIDVAASSSPFASLMRANGVEAYRVDLSYPPGLIDYDLGADAADMDFPDGFANHMAVHCALECFSGDADVRFFSEVARLLKPGGQCVVLPLYVNEIHSVTSSPYCQDGATAQTADPEGVFLWRDDSYRVPFDRSYSPETFAARIHHALPSSLSGFVQFADNIPELMQIYQGQRIYCFLQYVVEKK